MQEFSYNYLEKKLKTKDFYFWQSLAETRALDLFRQASRRVPAYKDFLKKNKINSDKIKKISDFKNLPLLNKKNYILQYSLNEVCWDGKLTKGGIISQSSGTTGEPVFWPRFTINDKRTALLHKLFFKKFYSSYEKDTLFIVCFYLGAHVAGIITSNAIRDLMDTGMSGSLVTAGLNKKDILNSIKKLSKYHKQTILIGYPPSLMDIICDEESESINWKEHNIKFMFSAESFPEKWRNKLYKKVGIDDVENNGFNVYGSTDLGFMGHETPFTIRLRQLIELKDLDRRKLGIENSHVPGIYQYHTWNKYFESYKNELVCTSDSGVPLVRYNTHDVGMVMSPEKIDQEYSDFDLLKTDDWHLPVLLVFGRSNYSATLYGVNIYPEHIREVLTHNEIIQYFSGKFFMKTVFGENHQALEIHLESSGKKIDVDLSEIQQLFSKYLKDINMEYKKLRHIVGKRVFPELIIYEKGSEEFKNLKAKHKYIIKEKN